MMRTLLILVLMAPIAPHSAQQMDRTDQEHTAWIDGVLRDIATIKPGMTRADLRQVFSEEGGLSTVGRRTYVYAHCPYIKVTFTFAPVEKPDAEGRIMNKSPDDKILTMSAPFLENTHVD